MTKNVNIAKRLARQKWGEIQSQEKVAEGCWFFDCAGHGGFIVDTEQFALPLDVEEDFQSLVMRRKGSTRYYPDEQHFAAFEEDNASYLFLYLYPEIAKVWYESDRWLPTFYDKFGTFDEYMNFLEQKVQKNWNKYYQMR